MGWMKSQRALTRSRVEVLGNYLLNDYGKTIAACDRASLCGRVEASRL